MVKCDFCDKPSVGYGSRQLQGPFYCDDHEEGAMNSIEDYFNELDDARAKYDAENRGDC